MSDQGSGISLCSSCTYSPDCSLRVQADAPIYDCEEFSPTGKSVPSMQAARTVANTQSNGSEKLGLCSTCAWLETCTFIRAEGGVWHCEEYETA